MADAARRLSKSAASCTASSLNAPRSGRRRGGGTGGASYTCERGGDGGWSFAQVSRTGGSATGGGGGRATTGLATSAGRAFSLPRLRLTYLRQALSVRGSQPPPAAARASATRLSFRALCIGLGGGHAWPCQLAIFPKPRAGSPPAPRRSGCGSRASRWCGWWYVCRNLPAIWHKNSQRMVRGPDLGAVSPPPPWAGAPPTSTGTGTNCARRGSRVLRHKVYSSYRRRRTEVRL